eukprot:Pgem_evm1s19584
MIDSIKEKTEKHYDLYSTSISESLPFDILTCEYDTLGSLASTHKTQGTDLGLCAGLLGYNCQHHGVLNSISTLEGKGCSFVVKYKELNDAHPNTYNLEIQHTATQTVHFLKCISTGGGAIQILKIDQKCTELTTTTTTTVTTTTSTTSTTTTTTNTDTEQLNSNNNIIEIKNPNKPICNSNSKSIMENLYGDKEVILKGEGLENFKNQTVVLPCVMPVVVLGDDDVGKVLPFVDAQSLLALILKEKADHCMESLASYGEKCGFL